MKTTKTPSLREPAHSFSLKSTLVAVAANLLFAALAAPAAAAQEAQPTTTPTPTPKGVWKVIGDLFSDDVTKVVVVVIAMVVAVGAIHLLLYWLAGRNARRWTAPLLAIRQNAGSTLLMSPNIKDTVLQDRLKQQLAEIEGRIDHHFTVFVDFFKYYYLSIGTFSTMALVAAITLFFITQMGLSNAKEKQPGLIAVFVVAAAAAAFYKSFISVYRQPDNIADNKQLYKNYIALENDLRSFCAVGEFKVDGQTGTAADFIAHVDQKLADFNNIAVGFDATKVDNYEGLLGGLTKQQVATLSPQPPGKAGQNGGSGQAEDKKGEEKKVQTGDQTNDAPPFDPAHPERPGTYTAQQGDTLESITTSLYKSADNEKQDLIRKANAGKVGEDGTVQAGTVLAIPALTQSGVTTDGAEVSAGNNAGG